MTNRTCIDCECHTDGKIRRGRCEACYRKLLKALKSTGDYQPAWKSKYGTPNVVSAILSRVEYDESGCWIFTGKTDLSGYGQIKISGVAARTHREMYKQLVGAIPDGLHLDHLCHTRSPDCAGGTTCMHRRCVNPAHLEPVTAAENNRRGGSLSAANTHKTHCVNGHEFTAENTAWRPPQAPGRSPWRQCRACTRGRSEQARNSRRRASAA